MPQKQNLVFIHGFYGDPSGLADVIKHLDPMRYNCFSPAMPPNYGVYLSEYTAQSYSDYLLNYLQTNHIKNPVLIGHSMGSIIASAFAARYPEYSADKLILLAPISHKLPLCFRLLQPLVFLFPKKLVTTIDNAFLITNRKSLKPILAKTIPYLKSYHRHLPILRSAIFSAHHAVSDFDFQKTTLIIDGESEKIVSRQKTAHLAVARSARLITLKNAGHLLNFEQPAAVAQAIDEFLQN